MHYMCDSHVTCHQPSGCLTVKCDLPLLSCAFHHTHWYCDGDDDSDDNHDTPQPQAGADEDDRGTTVTFTLMQRRRGMVRWRRCSATRGRYICWQEYKEVLGLPVPSVGCRNMHVHELVRGECTLHAQLRHTCSYTLSTC